MQAAVKEGSQWASAFFLVSISSKRFLPELHACMVEVVKGFSTNCIPWDSSKTQQLVHSEKCNETGAAL